jgi:CubicO group peptidase (beta-lactamase class C family)
MAGSQEKHLSEYIFSILLSYYNNKVFSAASGAYYSSSLADNENNLFCCGTLGGDDTEKVTPSTLFDLASLTKPLVTVLCVLSLIDNKKLAWDSPLSSLLPLPYSHPLKAIDIYSLMSHSSGLAAHRDFWKGGRGVKKDQRREWLLQELLKQDKEYQQGSDHLYSDLGYMLLGFIVELKVEKKLADYWTEVIAEPLGIAADLFFPVNREKACCRPYAATGVCGWSGEVLQGVVNDDNCRATGGVCGHAGLFGTAEAVLYLCRELLALYRGDPGRLPLSPETFRFACRRAGSSEWTAGFNLPSKQGSSAGIYFSEESIGHLGFTGTSFWIDLQKELIVVLLTNRVIAGSDQEGIKQLRPAVHNCLAEQRGKK